MTRILFVCYGNTCRSPMAMDILKQLLRNKGVEGVVVDCIGTDPYYPDNPEVKDLRERAVKEVMGDIDGLSEHVPKGFPEVNITSTDRLVFLAPEYMDCFERRIEALKETPETMIWEIPDPFTKPFEAYVTSAGILRDHIERNFNKLTEDSG